MHMVPSSQNTEESTQSNDIEYIYSKLPPNYPLFNDLGEQSVKTLKGF